MRVVSIERSPSHHQPSLHQGVTWCQVVVRSQAASQAHGPQVHSLPFSNGEHVWMDRTHAKAVLRVRAVVLREWQNR